MTTAPTKRPPWLARLLLAPLHLLERSRGRWRLALLFLYLIALAVGLLLAWRALSLRGLPDIGDPFDPDEFEARLLPSDENAFTFYEKAIAALKPIGPEHDLPRQGNWHEVPWSRAEPGARLWAEQNAEALGLWLEGSRRERALLEDPRRLHVGSLMQPAQELRDFARIGRLEASRRLEAGDVAGAWEVHRGVLRASRHLGHGGGAIPRMIGATMARVATDGISEWMADPRVGPDDLRRALADVQAAQALTAPASEIVKVEYLVVRNSLVGPNAWPTPEWLRSDAPNPALFLPGGAEALLWLKREPERSRRILQIAFDAWLAQADRPASSRPPTYQRPANARFGNDAMFYPPDPRLGLRPEALADWIDSSYLGRYLLSSVAMLQGAADADLRALAPLEVALAEELFRREHGRDPASMAELVGPYLDRLPDAYEGLDTPD